MKKDAPAIISASRRTDIPAFYLDWFQEQIKNEFVTVTNPVTKTSRTVALSPSKVHSIVFWSKNFAPFLASGIKKMLAKQGYGLYFNFTVNSENRLLEPHVPSLISRLDQMKQIAFEYGPKQMTWRFDPICCYRINKASTFENNLADFETIAIAASDAGIQTCVTSFFDPYKKISRRLKQLAGEKGILIGFDDPGIERKIRIIRHMEKLLGSLGIDLYLCCENRTFNALDPGSRVKENACIDGSKLKQLFGGSPVLTRDYGQRSRLGCRCTKSIDIGSYDDHPCYHNCLFCYASPSMDFEKKHGKNET